MLSKTKEMTYLSWTQTYLQVHFLLAGRFLREKYYVGNRFIFIFIFIFMYKNFIFDLVYWHNLDIHNNTVKWQKSDTITIVFWRYSNNYVPKILFFKGLLQKAKDFIYFFRFLISEKGLNMSWEAPILYGYMDRRFYFTASCGYIFAQSILILTEKLIEIILHMAYVIKLIFLLFLYFLDTEHILICVCMDIPVNMLTVCLKKSYFFWCYHTSSKK